MRSRRIRTTLALLTLLSVAVAVAASTAGAGGSPQADRRRSAISPAAVAEPLLLARDGHVGVDVGHAIDPRGWGGKFTTASGVTFRLYATESYPVDPGWLQRWAEWVDVHLYHGSELGTLTIVFAKPAEVERMCGERALGCYSSASSTIVTPGEDPGGGRDMETVLAHEYGHHVAANRVNPPWSASAYGPKRWATYKHVCQRVAEGRAFPGDEGANYSANPGEAWAQTYATAVQTLQSWPDASWPSVGPWTYDIVFFPDQQSLVLAREDATTPWTASATRTRTWTGRFTSGRRTVTKRLAATYDGTLSATVVKPFGGRLALREASTGKLLARSGMNLSYTICGERQLTLTITGEPGQSYRVTAGVP